MQELTIRPLDEGETYKYLGIEETNQIYHQNMRKILRESFVKVVKIILKTKLTPKNKILAINQIAILKIQYSFGVIDWPQHEINTIDISTRKLLCQYKALYEEQSHARLYIPRAKDGMVLIEIDVTYKANITSLAQYIVCVKGQYAPILRKHYYSVVSEKNLVKLAVNFREPENLEERQAEPTTVAR